jgi:hypothetical protein
MLTAAFRKQEGASREPDLGACAPEKAGSKDCKDNKDIRDGKDIKAVVLGVLAVLAVLWVLVF